MAKFIEHRLEHPCGYFVMIVEAQGKAFVELAVLTDEQPTVATINSLSTSVENRGHGLATTLMNRCQELAADVPGLNRICLWVTKANWTYGWYQRLGFVEYADHETEPGAVWMEKTLTK